MTVDGNFQYGKGKGKVIPVLFNQAPCHGGVLGR